MTSWPRVREQSELRSLFESDDERAYWISTFDRLYTEQSAGQEISWDYAWYHACMWNGLSIHPAVNLVANIGSGALASHTHDLGELSNRPTGPLEAPLRHPDRVVRDRQADLDTFDHRFPGALLKRQRSFGHQIGRPDRWASRALSPLARRVRTEHSGTGVTGRSTSRSADRRSTRTVCAGRPVDGRGFSASRIPGDGVRHLPAILSDHLQFGEPRWLLFP